MNFLQQIKNLLANSKENKAITAFDVTIFFRQFTTLLSAGISMADGLNIIEKSQHKQALRLLIYAIKRDIASGKSLSTNLQKYPQYFDSLTCHLIQIGEHTGKLDSLLQLISNHREKQLFFYKRLQQTLFYPGLISLAALLIMMSLFIFVIPRFAELFQESSVKLPLLTLMIFKISSLIRQSSFCLIMSLAILGILFCYKKSSRTIRRLFNQFFLHLPFIQSYFRQLNLLHFSRNLAIMFLAGLPILDSLKLIAEATSPEFARILTRVRHQVNAGIQLHVAMHRFPEFPILMVQMIKIGEESGQLDAMLNKSADFLEAEIEQFLTRLTELLEPLIIVVLGVVIGGLVVGMYLPIFKLGNTL